MKNKPSIINNVRAKIATLINPSINSMGLPKQFLRFGNKMTPNWTEVEMSDRDLYTGYPYAAIRNRANKVAKIAIDYVYTDSNNDEMHPYLKLINTSPSFSNYDFWKTISTYLDLEGVFYLMAIRNTISSGTDTRFGDVQQLKLLNPYNIKRVIKKETGEVVGYIENKKGLTREIPPSMIIEIRELNPFDDNEPFAMTDALKESQFTLRTSSDYTRHTLKHNINAPGILTTDVILDDKQFTNFVSRVKSHTKGEPIFGNGDGAVKWQDMNIDLSKVALKEINEQSRESLFAISGVSKTTMGIEQSGVTRETSKTQTDLFIENHVLPQIQLIIDSLNQDYKNKYKNEYSSNEYTILVRNPTMVDHDKDIKEVELNDKKIDLYDKMLSKGYDEETSAQYVKSEIDVDSLPVVERPTIVEPVVDEPVDDKAKEKSKNELDKKEQEKRGLVQQQQGSLQNAVVNIETELVADFINGVKKLTKKTINDITDDTKPDDFVSKSEKKSRIDDLAVVLATFYGVVMSWKGSETMRSRVTKFALGGTYMFNRVVKKYIKDTSQKVAQKHIETVQTDLYKIAREAAKKGLSQTEIINEIKNKYSYDISETRAKTVARSETNRAFTRAQYEADKQFVEQNELQGRVFKVWHTRSDNPCDFCKELESEGEIPFDNSFRDIGQSITVGKGKNKKILDVEFESLEAGNAHPNCSCEYELIIKTENNQLDEKLKSTASIIDKLSKSESDIKQSEELLEKAKSVVKVINRKKKQIDKKEKEVNKTVKELEGIL